MSLTVYPASGFDSWTSREDANNYFGNRIRGIKWEQNSEDIKDQVLRMAFQKLSLLNLNVGTIFDELLLSKLKTAQMEQAFYELQNNTDNQSGNVKSVDLDGVKVNWSQAQVDPYSALALNILREYIPMRTVKGVR